jgi:hypothetical protein
MHRKDKRMPVTLKDHGLNFESFDKFDREGNLPAVKNLLNATGCGFCLAKFRQITLHLGTGMIHSCHHPSPHKIPLENLEQNPLSLLNTPRLKSGRKQMLNDEKPNECDYCWRIEDNNGDSDRFYKSAEIWSLPDHDAITSLTGDEDIYPSYLEVSFGNTCNLSCLYCGPEFSSKWVEELKEQGPVVLFSEFENGKKWTQGYQDLDTLNYKNREFNPYIDAFWKIFPEVYKHLKHYRITGGEPLLSKETFRSMDWFIKNPNPELEFSINSNLSVPEKLWREFVEKLQMLSTGKVKKIAIYTSIEGWGERASYARSGLDFELLKSRVEELAELGNIRVVIMSAFNIFSISSFKDLLEWVDMLKKKYNPNNTLQTVEERTGWDLSQPSFTHRRKQNPMLPFSIGIDIPYLRHPTYLDAQICTEDLLTKWLLPCLEFMSSRVVNPSWSDHQGFETYEFEKLKRIVVHRLFFNKKNSPKRETDQDIVSERAAFYDFVNQMDQRRGTNFLTTFPEYADFYAMCKLAREQHTVQFK